MKGDSYETTPIPNTETPSTGPDGSNQRAEQRREHDHQHTDRTTQMTTLDDIAALLRQQNELLQRFVMVSTIPAQSVPAKSANDQRAENAFRKMKERKSK